MSLVPVRKLLLKAIPILSWLHYILLCMKTQKISLLTYLSIKCSGN